MRTDRQDHLSGYLLATAAASQRIARSALEVQNRVRFVREVEQTSWEEFVFRSDIPLLPDDVASGRSEFQYPLFCRRSGHRLLLTSTSKITVDHLLLNVYGALFQPPLQHVGIAVQRLVELISSAPGDWALTFIHARISVHAGALRAISLYGEDVTESSLFRESLKLEDLVCHTCGVRDVTRTGEIVRLGNDGSVSFYFPNQTRLVEVETVLGYVSSAGLFQDRGREADASESDWGTG